MTREELLKQLSELQAELQAAEQKLWARLGKADRAWDAEERIVILRASRGDMSALARRIESGEATDVERMCAANILTHPDKWPKHSFENKAEANRDMEIAEVVDFIVRYGDDKTSYVVEEWATKVYELGRSQIWERIKRGRLLLPQKVKAEDAEYLGRLEPDGNGGLEVDSAESPVKPQK